LENSNIPGKVRNRSKKKTKTKTAMSIQSQKELSSNKHSSPSLDLVRVTKVLKQTPAPNSRIECKKQAQLMIKMAQIDILFITKMDEKTIPFGAAHRRGNPAPPGFHFKATR